MTKFGTSDLLFTMLKSTGLLDLALGELETDEVFGGDIRVNDWNPTKKTKNVKSEI